MCQVTAQLPGTNKDDLQFLPAMCKNCMIDITESLMRLQGQAMSACADSVHAEMLFL